MGCRSSWDRGTPRWARALPFAAGLLLACQSGGTVAPSASDQAAPVKLEARPALIWSDGARYAYRFSLASGAELAGQKSMEFALSALVSFDVRRADAEETAFAAALTEARITAKDPENQAQFDALARELGSRFAFKLHQGVLAETRMPVDTTAFAASIRRTLASLLQFAPQPAAASGDVWTAQEIDATGTYQAEYRRGSNGTIRKRKVKYDARSMGKTTLGTFASLVPQIANSTGTWRLEALPTTAGEAAQLRLAELEANEKIVSQLTPGAALSADTSAKLTFVRQERPEPRLDWDVVLADTRIFSPTERVGVKPPVASYDSLRIGTYTFASALNELEKQGQDPKTNQLYDKVREEAAKPEELAQRESTLKSQARVFTAMEAILRSQPAHIPAAVARIRAHSSAARPLIDALSSAGTVPAQRALIELMNDAKAPKGVRQTAAFALTRTPNPSPEAIDALARNVDDDLLRVYALYGLGTLSRHLRDAGETERADAIADVLVAALKKSATPSRQVDALRAIANSGADSAFPAVQPFLEAQNATVRVAAVDAIRLMHRPEVDTILANVLQNGPDDVRLAAIEAANVREPSAVLAKSLQSLADATDRPGLKLKIVRVMGNWLKARPEFKSPLQKFAQSDASEQVRLAAQNALGT